MTLPYDIPFDGSEGGARVAHRTWYWEEHDMESYTCPVCDRGIDRVYQFEVHHIDGDPLNGDPKNLVALCKRCHRCEHEGKTISSLDTEEWKEEFENIV